MHYEMTIIQMSLIMITFRFWLIEKLTNTKSAHTDIGNQAKQGGKIVVIDGKVIWVVPDFIWPDTNNLRKY